MLVALQVATTLAASLGACTTGTSADAHERSVKQYELAVGLQAEGNFPSAFKTLFKAIELDPDNANAHQLLANLFLMRRADNPDRHDPLAEKHFGEVLRIERGSDQPSKATIADALNGLGVLRVHQGRHDEAIVSFKEAIDEDLFNARAYMAWGNLGWAYAEKGDYQDSIQALRRAVGLNRGFCVGHYRLGKSFLATKAFSEAEQALTKALEVDERCASFQDAWHLRGAARMGLGYRDDARSDFERCIELAPSTEAGTACSRYLEATY
ncbi:MAG: tetratricopeptide repeat protein [Myxococcales bacterium]|nr:tetratricopeptide repeat protein [Myxococcales bacterium]MDD9969839.1 tetratricopeptide repeat protein [Myxococcales bacterium]